MTFRERLAAKIQNVKAAVAEKLTQEPAPQKTDGPVLEVSSELLSDGSELVKYSDGSTRHFRFESVRFQEKFGSSRLPNLGEGDDFLTHEQRSLIGSVRESADVSELDGVDFVGERRGTPVTPEEKQRKTGWRTL